MLAPSGSESECVAALELGADDYVTKPFSMSELLARVRAILRRARDGAAAVYEDGRLRINFDEMRAVADGSEIKLTRKEFALLCALVRRRGRVGTRAQLLSEVWGRQCYGDGRTLDVHVRRLRQTEQHRAVKGKVTRRLSLA